jgi:hypothetical protein
MSSGVVFYLNLVRGRSLLDYGDAGRGHREAM